MEPTRITEVLNYFHQDWEIDWVCKVGKREANRIKKEAMAIGTRVDELIKKNPLSPDEFLGPKKERQEIINCIGAYTKWLDIYKPKEIIPGTRLNATIDDYPVTGEPDLFVDGVLVDIKCSSKISPNYWIQVNMYRYLQNRHTSMYDQVAILRLDKKTGSYEYVVQNFDITLCGVWRGLFKAYLYYRNIENVE